MTNLAALDYSKIYKIAFKSKFMAKNTGYGCSHKSTPHHFILEKLKSQFYHKLCLVSLIIIVKYRFCMHFHTCWKPFTTRIPRLAHMEYCQKRSPQPTFFIIPVFRFENVVYRRSLLSMYSIFILTRPLVFFPLDGGDFLG